jgi:acetyltransferase-like isoleucine patch superfamily enzyme
MVETPRRSGGIGTAFRVAWTIGTFLVVEAFVCGAAVLPVVLLWTRLVMRLDSSVARLVVASLAAAPSYILFALCLMPVSALVTRALGWNTPADASLPIAAFDWPLLSWARAMAAAHIVRLFAGTLFRASPIWTAYLRLNGARIGRRVYVNSLAVSDHNLLEFGDDVVIGADAHISGHTVEGGLLKTSAVRLGSNVTIGIGAIVEIGVTVGSDCQIGALSFVPKHMTLASGAVYAGAPVHRLK